VREHQLDWGIASAVIAEVQLAHDVRPVRFGRAPTD
jgi:hypothetical protein